ncbi:MAG: hypothetical protein K2L96_06290 [Muribaculaceae bacterium]|nr:hypothetical protein [Muribaculaceae bacterium]
MKKLILLLSAALAASFAADASTFKAQVPDGTKKCYVCGAFNGWSAVDAYEMTPVESNLFTLELPDVTDADVAGGFKYLCGPDWAYVEKSSTGAEISNRTKTGDPDIVGSWAAMPEWVVESVEVMVNGLPRGLKVYVPEGYEDSDENYPVIYYNTVQQRYNDAGSDSDCGDYFFGVQSWNANEAMETARKNGGRAYVMVQIPSMLAENTLEANDEFAGTGDMARYLTAFVDELMPYVEEHWRVMHGAEATTIVGADFGALFSLYAAMERPDVFGTCVAMSPMLWINEGALEALASSSPSTSQTAKFYVSAGSLEPQWLASSAESMAESLKNIPGATVHYTLYPGASHHDVAWGDCFPSVLEAIGNGGVPEAVSPRRAMPVATTAFESTVYTLYGGENSLALERIGDLVYTEDFHRQGSAEAIAAYVITNDIPVSVKGKYYWNVAIGPDADKWKYSSNQSISFSSKKTDISWQNIAVLESGSVKQIAASSAAFRVLVGSESYTMTPTTEHLSKATVKFPGKDKSFVINFGSVNSRSDMGAMTPVMSVSEDCVEAEILYDFNLNKVTVTETQFGRSLDDVAVLSFSAVPAVCRAGSDVHVNLELSAPCDVELGCVRDFGSAVALDTQHPTSTGYTIAMSDLAEGLYTITLNLVAGNNRIENAAQITIRVLPEGVSENKSLTVNAYKNVDWATVGRYKANFHTHTSQSFDTQYTTTQVVDRYHNAGYKILALTDHDANPYPWRMFSLWNTAASDRDPVEMGMLAIPGNELSKDRRNSWSEKTGGEFNHHNDLFTGRRGQEFMSLRESYAYTQALGGIQLINHPGQYWNLATEYVPGAKNSPEWHAENFRLYSSLAGLEVYNQGNRRPNDRILWDQILTINMPSTPVWGYSNDDTHTAEQYFRNYQFMLMPELTVDALKDAMATGAHVFSYEFTGSGKDLAPKVNSIVVDDTAKTITIDTDDAETIEWIYSTHRTNPSSAASCASTVVGYGKTFDFSGYQGSYVRARLLNKYGETATQPFGFEDVEVSGVINPAGSREASALVARYDSAAGSLELECKEGIVRATVFAASGIVLRAEECAGNAVETLSHLNLTPGAYIVVAATDRAAYTATFMAR